MIKQVKNMMNVPFSAADSRQHVGQRMTLDQTSKTKTWRTFFFQEILYMIRTARSVLADKLVSSKTDSAAVVKVRLWLECRCQNDERSTESFFHISK